MSGLCPLVHIEQITDGWLSLGTSIIKGKSWLNKLSTEQISGIEIILFFFIPEGSVLNKYVGPL